MTCVSRLVQVAGHLIVPGFAAMALCLVAVAGCGRQPPTAQPLAFEPETIKQLVNQAKGKKQPLGMGIKDGRVAAAGMLAKVGPQAQEYGAVEVLEKLAQDKDPDAQAAAIDALAKIKTP